MRLIVDLTEEQFKNLWNRAVREVHFLREEPRKAWHDKERREIVRRWIEHKASTERD